MRDEMAIAREEDTLTVLWDMEKIYDNICTVKLIKEACRLGYPMLVFRLGLMMNMALWMLSKYNNIPGMVQPKNGIIARCSKYNLCKDIFVPNVIEHVG